MTASYFILNLLHVWILLWLSENFRDESLTAPIVYSVFSCHRLKISYNEMFALTSYTLVPSSKAQQQGFNGADL